MGTERVPEEKPVTCPACGTTFLITEEQVENRELVFCPACGWGTKLILYGSSPPSED